MAMLGYAVVIKEDNIHWCCGAEFLLIKVEQRCCNCHITASTGQHSAESGSLDELFAVMQVGEFALPLTLMHIFVTTD